MKRSEAMDKLQKLCDARDMPKEHTWEKAVRDLLNAEEDDEWEDDVDPRPHPNDVPFEGTIQEAWDNT